MYGVDILGGGIEVDEDYVVAVAREILEETGCTIEMDMDNFFLQKTEECEMISIRFRWLRTSENQS